MRGLSPRHCAQATLLLLKKYRNGDDLNFRGDFPGIFDLNRKGDEEILNTVSDLTGPRFEPQTSRSRDEPVTTRPSGRSFDFVLCKTAIVL